MPLYIPSAGTRGNSARVSRETLLCVEVGSRAVDFFHGVARHLEPDIEVWFYSTKVKVRSKLSRMGYTRASLQNDHENFAPVPANVIAEILNDKIIASSPDRKHLLDRLRCHYDRLGSLLDSQRISAVFLWNGSGLAASVAVHIARAHGVRTIFGENGYFPGTMQLDPEGVNYAASITRTIGQEYLGTVADPARLNHLNEVIEGFRHGRSRGASPPRERVRASWWAYLVDTMIGFSWQRIAAGRGGTKGIHNTLSDLPDRFVFIPFQVRLDSQVLMYSPLVGNDMRKFLTVCREAVRAAAPDYKVVVKPHPACRENYSELMREYGDVIWLNDCSTREILEHASLVVTINSTVGLEALMLHKPVITLGLNFYNVERVVRHVESLDDLPRAIAAALREPVDLERTDRLLYYLYYHYFTHASRKDHSEASYRAAADKLRSLMDQSIHSPSPTGLGEYVRPRQPLPLPIGS